MISHATFLQSSMSVPAVTPTSIFSARNRSRLLVAAYQDFLTLWKDADPDVPILKQAKAEYTKLQYSIRFLLRSRLTACAMNRCSMRRKSHHLRHSKFAGLREDKDARTVIKEHDGEG